MTIDEAMRIVEDCCEQRLSHLGGKVVVRATEEYTSFPGMVGVGIVLPGIRHAVAIHPEDAIADPAKAADNASTAILAWHKVWQEHHHERR